MPNSRKSCSASTNEGNETISVPTRSLATIEESLTISRRLAASDPTNAKYRGDLLADLAELAHVKVRHGDPVEALSVYEESLTVRCSKERPRPFMLACLRRGKSKGVAQARAIWPKRNSRF